MSSLSTSIEWRTWDGEAIVSKFNQEDWHLILSDVSSDCELAQLRRYDFVHVLVAYKSRASASIAFVLLIDDLKNNTRVQLHGGCWSGSAWDSYGVLITIIEKLLEQGKTIRTSCTIENVHAFCFLRSVGFVNHYTSRHYHYFWLPYKRFINTPIYKRIHG